MEPLNNPYRRWRTNLNDPLTSDSFTSVEFYVLNPATSGGEDDSFVRVAVATDLLVAPEKFGTPVTELVTKKSAPTPLDPTREVCGLSSAPSEAFMPLVDCKVIEEFDWTCTQPKIGTLSFSFSAPWLMDTKRHDTEGVDEIFAFLDMFDYTDGSSLDALSRPVCLIGVRSGFYEFNAVDYYDENGVLVSDESDYTLDSTVYFPYTVVSKTYDYGKCTFSVECEDIMGLLSGFRAYSYKSASYACACTVNRSGYGDFGVNAVAGGDGAYTFDTAAFRAGRSAAKRETLLHNMAENMMAQPSITHMSVFPASSHRGNYVDSRAMDNSTYGTSGGVFEPDFTAISTGFNVKSANAKSLSTRGTELFKPSDVDVSRAGLGFSTDYAWDTSFLDLWYSIMNLHGMRLFPVDLGDTVGIAPPYKAVKADQAPSLTEDGWPMRIYPSVIYDGAPTMETLESAIVSSSTYRGFSWNSKVPGDSLAYDDEIEFEVDVVGKVPVVADTAHIEGSTGKTFVNTDSAIFPFGLFCGFTFGHMAWSTPMKVPLVGLAAVVAGETDDAGDWWATDKRSASQSAYSLQGWTWGLDSFTARAMPSFAGYVSGGKVVNAYPPVGTRFGYAKPRGDSIIELDQSLYRDGAAFDGAATLIYPKNNADDVVVTNPLASAAVRDGLRVSSGRELQNRLCWNAECALEAAKNASGHPYHRSSYKAVFTTKNDPSMRVGNVVEVAYHDRWVKVLLTKSSRSLGSSKKCEWEGWNVGYGEGSPLDYSMGAASIRTWVNGARSHLEIAVNDNVEALVNHDVRYEFVRTTKLGIEDKVVVEATLDDPTALIPGAPESIDVSSAAYHLALNFNDLPEWRDDDRMEMRTWLDGTLVDTLAHRKGSFAASAWLWPGDFDTRIYPSIETWPGSRLLPWNGVVGTYPAIWLFPGTPLFPEFGDGTASYASDPLPTYPSAMSYPHGNEF